MLRIHILAQKIELYLADHKLVHTVDSLQELKQFKKYSKQQLGMALRKLFNEDLVARTTTGPIKEEKNRWYYMHIGFV